MAMDPAAAGGAPRFSIGGVISKSVSILFEHFFRFAAIILLIGVPAGAVIFGSGALLAQSPAAEVSGLNITIEDPDAAQVAVLILSVLAGLLGYCWIMAAVTQAALQALREGSVGIRACLAVGLRALPRLILAIIVLLFVLVLVGGVILLFLGMIASGVGMLIISLGVMVFSLYFVTLISVAVPALVAERAGALECFSRSLVLTSGHRWGIFAIVVVLSVANWAATLLLQALWLYAPAAGNALNLAVSLLFLAGCTVLAAVGYHQLRAEKEGFDGGAAATVFD